MSTKTINTRVINKHDVEANWNKAVNFVPLKGEIIVYEKDDTHTTARFKIGDGTTKVTELPFSSIPDNVLTTDKANIANGYAALDATKYINITGMKIPCIDSFDYEDETTYSSKGVNCTDKDGFTISTFHGKKINFGSKMPSKITTDFNQFIFEGYYSDEKGYSHKGSIILYNNFNGTRVEDLALWCTNTSLKDKSVIRSIIDMMTDINNLKKNTGTGTYSTIGTTNEIHGDAATNIIDATATESKNNHIEGANNTIKKATATYKIEANHIEGEHNINGGYAGHTENSCNQVYETNAHAGGKHTVASGSGAFSQGRGLISFGTATFSTGQSAFGDDSNRTTVLGEDGTDTAIEWGIKDGESEAERAKRISDRLIGLWHGTVKITGSEELNTSVKQQFTAAIGSGAMSGGINTLVNGGASFGHGFKCEVDAQFGVATGCQASVLANGGFAHGFDIQTNATYGVTFGITNKNNAENAFMIGRNCSNNADAINSFVGGEQCNSQARNGFSFGLKCWANGPQTFALGEGIAVGTKNQFSVGQFNNNNSKALFTVGTGTSDTSRSNSFEVHANNNIITGSGCTILDGAKNSFTGGTGSQSQKNNNFTFGTNCYNSADNSVIFGEGIVIGKPGKFVVGKYNLNNSDALFAVGTGTNTNSRSNGFEVYETYSVANSPLVFAKTIRSASAGNNANNTIVFGTNTNNTATADNSFTGGIGSQSQAKNAFTFGVSSYAAAENSVAIGEGIVVGTKGQFAIGKYNDNTSNALFAVGNGTSSARKNVFEVFDNTIAINTDRISLSTTNDITTLKLGDFAKLQIKPSMASSGQYACSLIMNPIYGYTEPTVIEMDALSSSNICIGYTNNAVMFNYSNGSQPEFYTKDVANSHVKLFSSDYTEGKDELVKLSMALNNKSLFAAIADLINNGGGSGGSSNAVTYESDGSLKIGNYASITDSNMGTGVRELVANGSLGPATDPMKITFGYTNEISIPMGYNDSTSINFTSSTFEQPTFTIRGTSNSLKLYDGTDLSTLITTMKSKSYTSLCGAINALITNASGSGSSTTIITTYTATVSLDNNKEYHLISKNSTSLTLTLPSTITDDYNSYFSFKSGATATTITLPTSFTGTLKFKGDDCNSSGVFTPTANKIYEVALKCIGMDSNNKPYIVARVGAC